MTQSNENEYQIKTTPLAGMASGRLFNRAADAMRKYRGPLLVAVILMVLGIVGWHFQKQTLAAFSILQNQEAVSAYIQGFGNLGPLV
ncbi:MAG TPA: hypothetical protein PLK31_23055, partial [Chloroflexota bacterium]|nr:hypothetical protein [Chloroflexota bacterium]